MDYDNIPDDELITIDKTMTLEEREEYYHVLARRILWQEIVAKGRNYRMRAISICRIQDGCGLREAAYTVDSEYWRNEKKISDEY